MLPGVLLLAGVLPPPAGLAAAGTGALWLAVGLHRRRMTSPRPGKEAGRFTGPAQGWPVATSRSGVIVVPTTGLIVLPHDAVPVRADLEYQFHDCLAVTMVLRGPGEDVRWKFAWDLLARGLSAPVGSGDIAARPILGGRDAAVEISFQPSTSATVRFPAGDIRKMFRNRTYHEVIRTSNIQVGAVWMSRFPGPVLVWC